MKLVEKGITDVTKTTRSSLLLTHQWVGKDVCNTGELRELVSGLADFRADAAHPRESDMSLV
jgi:hypothetical protein